MDIVDLVRDQARVHDRNPGPCFGLPLCVSCRAVALIKNDMLVPLAEAWIAAQPAGVKVRLDEQEKEAK